MKQVFILTVTLLLTLTLSLKPETTRAGRKDPVIMEVTTKYSTVKEALQATKTALMKQKFVPSGGIGESGFTATRTTGSHSDYYTADVSVELADGKAKVTVTFIKSGSGMLKLQKVADELKAELSGSSETP